MKVTLLNTKEIDIDSPGFKENYFQHIYYLGTYINSPIIESDPDLKKQIEECIDKLPPNSHSEISKFAKLLEETTDATIDDYSEKIGDIIKTLTTNAILKEQFFTLATTANLNILSSATSSPAPTPITDSAPIPEATTTHIPTEEDSTPITAKHTTSTEAPPTPTTKTTTPVKPTTTTSATKKTVEPESESVKALKRVEYNNMLKIAEANGIRLPNVDNIDPNYEYGQNPIAKFLEAPNTIISATIKANVKRDLKQLEGTSLQGEKRGYLIKKLNKVLNFPGWGAAKDKGEEHLNKIITGKEQPLELKQKINAEIDRVKEYFANSPIVGMDDIQNIFIEHYRADLTQRHFALKGGKKYTPKPFPPICLDGPPGTGKTSIARVIAEALGLAFHVHGLEKNPDMHSITGRGSGWTDGGAPGFITEAKCKVDEESSLVLMLIDELEKGTPEIINALGSPLAVNTDKSIKDEYFEDDVPTSGVYFVATSNGYDLLASHIKSRVKRIDTPGFNSAKKIDIVKRWAEKAFTEELSQVQFQENAEKYLVEHYSYEPGARELLLMLDKIKDKALSKIVEAEDNTNPIILDIGIIDDTLQNNGFKKLTSEQTEIVKTTEKFTTIKSRLSKLQDQYNQSGAFTGDEAELNKCREEFVKVGNELLTKYSAILSDKRYRFSEDYQQFIAESKKDVNRLTLHHNNKLLSYKLKFGKLNEQQKTEATKEKFLIKITLLKTKYDSILLNIKNLEEQKNSGANYERRKVNTIIGELQKASEELEKQIKFSEDKLLLETLKVETPEQQQQEFSSSLITKFNIHIKEAQKSLDFAKLVQKDDKLAEKLTKRIAEMRKDLAYMEGVVNNRATNKPKDDKTDPTTKQTPNQPDEKKTPSPKVDTSSTPRPPTFTTKKGPEASKDSEKTSQHSNDDTVDDDSSKDKGTTFSAKSRTTPTPDSKVLPTADYPPITPALKSHLERLKSDQDIKRAALNKDFKTHLEYKGEKIDNRGNQTPKQADQKFGGLDQKLSKDSKDGFWADNKTAKRDSNYPSKPEKKLENLRIEETLYLGWNATNPMNKNQVQIVNTDPNGTKKSFDIDRQNDTLKMTSEVRMLDDAMITQMVESQKRAGNSVITVNGLCKETQTPEDFKKGLINAKKFYDAAKAINIEIQFDALTSKALNEVFNIDPNYVSVKGRAKR